MATREVKFSMALRELAKKIITTYQCIRFYTLPMFTKPPGLYSTCLFFQGSERTSTVRRTARQSHLLACCSVACTCPRKTKTVEYVHVQRAKVSEYCRSPSREDLPLQFTVALLFPRADFLPSLSLSRASEAKNFGSSSSLRVS